MMEYIDRNLCETVAEYDQYYKLVVPLEKIRKMPAADVAPVVHAEWDSDERCTACGEKSTEGLDAEKWNYWLPPYCPHCGAKMDGAERSTD